MIMSRKSDIHIPTPTEQVIAAMLKENTGRSFLDSGSAYGRNWERNQLRDFHKEPPCVARMEGDWLNVTYNVYYYLCAFLEYAPGVQDQFLKWCQEVDPHQEKHWPELMRGFACEGDNIYGGGGNTYNWEHILSQDLQYDLFHIEGEDHKFTPCILLQIHGGCDARGGYTNPKAFRMLEEDYFIMAQSDITAWVDFKRDKRQRAFPGMGEPPWGFRWYSDDCGYHWYADDHGTPKLRDILVEGEDHAPMINYKEQTYPLHVGVMDSY